MITKKFIYCLIFLCFVQASYALNVVYPKQKILNINSPTTFFIGSSDYSKPLTINGENTEVHKSGGFAKFVPLKFGENIFTLKSGDETLIYKITRPKPKNISSGTDVFSPYEGFKYLKVTNDNTPLRSTPVDGGINRLAHLQAGIKLVADGEKGEFYRIKLGENNYGWIAKNYLETDNIPAKQTFLYGGVVDSDDNFFVYKFQLTNKVPWAIEETPKSLNISIYNIDNAPKNNSYTIKIPIDNILDGGNLLGYNAYYDGNTFVVKIRKPLVINPDKPLNGVTIAIDAGHGGFEYGAIGCFGDLEKDITIKYAKDLAANLKSHGAKVVMTRNGDEYVGLRERVDKTNKENAVIFISLHGNALTDNKDPAKIFGTEIYYYYPQAKPLSQTIMNSMVNNAGVKNHGIIQQSFAVVRNTNALSILIEIGYLINPEDNYKIIDPSFRKNIVQAITVGLEEYLVNH